MKTAFIDGREVQAEPDAPPRAVCPACGEPVELRHQRGGWYYRHGRGTGAKCPLRKKPLAERPPRRPLVRGDPELTLAARLVRHAATDALNGDEEALAWLVEHPLPQVTLAMLGIDPDLALERLVVKAQQNTR